MSGRNFSLTEHLSDFVTEQVASGRHQNASEVVREALQRYEDDVRIEQADLAAIEKLAEQGLAAIARGDYTLVTDDEGSDALLNRLIERSNRRG